MSKKQNAVTLKTQATALCAAMGLEPLNLKGFQDASIGMMRDDDTAKSKWVELACIAPVTFGEGCFTKEKAQGEDWNEDYSLLKSTLEHAWSMAKYGSPMPDIQRVKPGTVLTAKQEAERKQAQDCRARVGTVINLMSKYFDAEVGAEKQTRKLPTLSAWCGSAHLALAGKVETTKAKAVSPKVSGAVPQVLIDLLACFTIPDAKDHAVQMQAWRDSVVKEDARIKSVQAIQAAQNRPRKAVKSDTPAKRTIKA